MIANIVVIGILAIAVGFAIRSLTRSKKSGGCAGCPGSGACNHRESTNESDKCACSGTDI